MLIRRLFTLQRHLRPVCSRAGTCSNMSSAGAEGEDVLVETCGRNNNKAVITLNRPAALNALNLSMIRKIQPRMKLWESEHVMRLVIMKGAGTKAFCAGGDIRAVTEAGMAGDCLAQDFFREEYILNNTIGTYSIPYVAIIDGITMGGGVGLSVHGMFRVATERTMFAMPETAIGLFPDVGGGHFLPRLGGHLGLYLALTGYRLKGVDVLRAGVATHYVTSDKLDELESALLELDKPNAEDVGKLLHTFHKQCVGAGGASEFTLAPHLHDIHHAFSATTVEGVLQNLEKQGTEWSRKQVETLRKMSPTSLKVTLRQLHTGLTLTLQECLAMEYRVSQRCVEPRNPDFFEGVRAVLLDKDNCPRWKPASIEEVTEELVEAYFAPLPEERELRL